MYIMYIHIYIYMNIDLPLQNRNISGLIWFGICVYKDVRIYVIHIYIYIYYVYTYIHIYEHRFTSSKSKYLRPDLVLNMCI
jgi:hypothetical protein